MTIDRKVLYLEHSVKERQSVESNCIVSQWL